MHLLPTTLRRQPGGRFRRLALAALVLSGLTGAGVPHQPVTAQSRTVAVSSTHAPQTASAAVPLAQAGASCGVYPFSIDQQLLALVEPMPYAWADVGAIPQASQFWVALASQPRTAYFLSWTGDQTVFALQAALTGSGTLGTGFREGDAGTPTPGPQVNGVLEAGDWITMYGNQWIGIAERLDPHIAQRTIMTLPVFDAISGSGSVASARVGQFVRVRLLDYNLSGTNKYMRFGLVAAAAPYACFQYQTPLLVGTTAVITPSMPLSGTLARRWDFGDGSPISTALTPTHVYAQAGSYTVTVTLPYTPTIQAIGRIEVQRPILPPQVFLPITLRRSAP